MGGTHLGGWQTGKQLLHCLIKTSIAWSHTDFSASLLDNLQLELKESTAADKLIDAFTKHGRTAERYILSESDAIAADCENV